MAQILPPTIADAETQNGIMDNVSGIVAVAFTLISLMALGIARLKTDQEKYLYLGYPGAAQFMTFVLTVLIPLMNYCRNDHLRITMFNHFSIVWTEFIECVG